MADKLPSAMPSASEPFPGKRKSLKYEKPALRMWEKENKIRLDRNSMSFSPF